MLEEISRSMLVFIHLLFFSGAIVLVLWTDFCVIKNGLSDSQLHTRASCVIALFVLLWMTGLSIVFIDTGFQFAAIISNSKLQIKLVCVLVLTLNGVILHLAGLKTLTRKDSMNRPQATFLCVIGALSITNWFLAGFIGSANMLMNFSFKFLLIDYLAIVTVACLTACLISGHVQKRLNWLRACVALEELGIKPGKTGAIN